MQALLRSSWRTRGAAAQALPFGVWRPAGGAASTASPSPPLPPPQSELPSQHRLLFGAPLAVDSWLVRGMSSSSRAARPAPQYESLPRSWAVLGGGGAVGQMLVDHLIDSGADQVKVLDLKAYGGKHKDSPQVTSIIGSVTDREKVDEAVAGMNTVVSAVTPFLPTATWNQFISVNLYGTATALNATAASPAARAFVNISSMAVFNHDLAHEDCDEDTPLPNIMDYTSAYDLTKRLGEELVLQANADAVSTGRPLRTIALRPGGILTGYRDYTLKGIFQDGVAYMEGKALDFSYGLNVCHAVVLAACKLQDPKAAAAGKALMVTKGDNITLGQLSRDIGTRLGKKIPILPWPVLTLVNAGSVLTHAFRNYWAPQRAPAIPTHRFIGQADFVQSFRCDKASQLIGYSPLYSYDEMLDTVVNEYKEAKAAGLIK